jgi:hypothetical protein
MPKENSAANPAAVEEAVEVVAKVRIQHDGVWYEAGESIMLRASCLDQLLEVKAVAPAAIAASDK